MADADWLHGGAEALLTVTNVLLLLGFRGALKGDAEASDAEWARLGAAAAAVAATILIATGVPVFHFEAHDAFLGGLGATGWGSSIEPVNALSVPTWAVHFSSVCEFVLAMRLATVYAARTGDERWNGVAWGMLPSHASGVCACTYHLFYNQAALAWLVTAQAGLTLLGNTTLFIAALRLALGNGWTFQEALPSFAGGPAKDDDAPSYALNAAAIDVADDLTPGPLLIGEIVLFTIFAAYLTKYGSLLALPVLTSPNSILAGLVVAAPPAAVALTVLPKPDLSLPDFANVSYVRRADLPLMNRGDAAAATWIFCGDESDDFGRLRRDPPEYPRGAPRRGRDPAPDGGTATKTSPFRRDVVEDPWTPQVRRRQEVRRLGHDRVRPHGARVLGHRVPRRRRALRAGERPRARPHQLRRGPRGRRRGGLRGRQRRAPRGPAALRSRACGGALGGREHRFAVL